MRTSLHPSLKKRGKRGLLALCAALFILLILSLVPAKSLIPAAALTGEEEAALAEIEARVEELLASLDTKQLQEYLDSLSQTGGISVKEKLLGLIKGDLMLEYDTLGEAVLALVWEESRGMLPAFAVILAVSLLCGILNSAKSGFLHSTMSDMIHFVGYLAAGAVTLTCLIDVLQAGYDTILQMKRQMEIVYPLLLTLMAASGGAVSAAVYRPAVAFLSSAVCNLFTQVVLPSSLVVVVLGFLGNLSTEVRTEKLGDFFKSTNKWLIGLTLGIFSLFLTVQGITSAQYDGLSLRAAKYVVSGSVPVVGGFLSGGLDLVLAGSALIKNALGSFSVFLLFGTALRPALLFGVFGLFLRLSAAVCEPVGGRFSALFSRLAGDLGYFLAGLLCVAFLYFLTLVLLICSSGVIF